MYKDSQVFELTSVINVPWTDVDSLSRDPRAIPESPT